MTIDVIVSGEFEIPADTTLRPTSSARFLRQRADARIISVLDKRLSPCYGNRDILIRGVAWPNLGDILRYGTDRRTEQLYNEPYQAYLPNDPYQVYAISSTWVGGGEEGLTVALTLATRMLIDQLAEINWVTGQVAGTNKEQQEYKPALLIFDQAKAERVTTTQIKLFEGKDEPLKLWKVSPDALLAVVQFSVTYALPSSRQGTS